MGFTPAEVALARIRYALHRIEFGAQHALDDAMQALCPVRGAMPYGDRLQALHGKVKDEWYRLEGKLRDPRAAAKFLLDRDYDPQWDDKYIAGAEEIDAKDRTISDFAKQCRIRDRRIATLEAVVRELLGDHQRMEPHHAHLCDLCKRAAELLGLKDPLLPFEETHPELAKATAAAVAGRAAAPEREVTAGCGDLCRADEICPACGKCGGQVAGAGLATPTEWQGCCRCRREVAPEPTRCRCGGALHKRDQVHLVAHDFEPEARP